ncbi:ATP-binding protein [Gracilibacillus massiliensis]|uniref:ATP-binding protein n=1 Tax=Gracilibacillus massiliensis TaxID=1564956 RepID=UPI00071CE4B6|nr:ATP-binding protein [Gracilibacillus massiliensis]
MNEAYIKQVFVNLIKNSIESFESQNTSNKIEIVTDIKWDHIIIEISDTGEGIQQENFELIFDPLISSKEEGMGVGLPFVRKIIFEHRGEIKVKESSASGTTFKITLPQYEFSDFNQ